MKKKLYGVCATILLCVLFVAFAGCAPTKSSIIKSLKKSREFVTNKYEEKYKIDFIIEEDFSYSLSLSSTIYAELKDYRATGTLEYIGSYKERRSSTTWNITRHYTDTYYAFKLDGASVELPRGSEKLYRHDFYLMVESSTAHSDSYGYRLVVHTVWDDGSEKVSARDISGTEFVIGEKDN